MVADEPEVRPCAAEVVAVTVAVFEVRVDMVVVLFRSIAAAEAPVVALLYVNDVVVGVEATVCTPLYPTGVTPEIATDWPTARPWGTLVVTVTTPALTDSAEAGTLLANRWAVPVRLPVPS